MENERKRKEEEERKRQVEEEEKKQSVGNINIVSKYSL